MTSGSTLLLDLLVTFLLALPVTVLLAVRVTVLPAVQVKVWHLTGCVLMTAKRPLGSWLTSSLFLDASRITEPVLYEQLSSL